jgi:hypothetical protein
MSTSITSVDAASSGPVTALVTLPMLKTMDKVHQQLYPYPSQNLGSIGTADLGSSLLSSIDSIPYSPTPTPPKQAKKKKGMSSSPRAHKERGNSSSSRGKDRSPGGRSVGGAGVGGSLNEVVGFELSGNPLDRRLKDPDLPTSDTNARPLVDQVSTAYVFPWKRQ